MSSRDHPDWWRPTGGQNSQDSILERRSLVWNDDDIAGPTVPDAFYEAVACKGKFFTRGCRGMIEELQLYCIGDGADTITLRYSPHPCLGPFGEVVITPAAAWAWQAFVIEEMWDYDSLFIWVHECDTNVDWAYDAELPYDGHESPCCAILLEAACIAAGCYWDGATCWPGRTWEDTATRPFIRVVYTGETPGDVPVSGIINIIKIPNASAEEVAAPLGILQNVLTSIVAAEGAGYCDLVIFEVWVGPSSHLTFIEVQCDGEIAFRWQLGALNTRAWNDNTQPISLLRYAEDGNCTLMLTKMFEFKYLFQVLAQNMAAGVTAEVHIYPTLLK